MIYCSQFMLVLIKGAEFLFVLNFCTTLCSATLIFEVELVACRPRKGSSLSSVSDERTRLE